MNYYIIVRAKTIKELEEKVNRKILERYIVKGGVSPVTLPNGQVSDLLQSMVLKELEA